MVLTSKLNKKNLLNKDFTMKFYGTKRDWIFFGFNLICCLIVCFICFMAGLNIRAARELNHQIQELQQEIQRNKK